MGRWVRGNEVAWFLASLCLSPVFFPCICGAFRSFFFVFFFCGSFLFFCKRSRGFGHGVVLGADEVYNGSARLWVSLASVVLVAFSTIVSFYVCLADLCVEEASVRGMAYSPFFVSDGFVCLHVWRVGQLFSICFFVFSPA